jgi:hypothetical protein
MFSDDKQQTQFAPQSSPLGIADSREITGPLALLWRIKSSIDSIVILVSTALHSLSFGRVDGRTSIFGASAPKSNSILNTKHDEKLCFPSHLIFFMAWLRAVSAYPAIAGA